MAWNPEYTEEFNSLMEKWDNEIHAELEKSAPTRGLAAGSKGKTDIINEKYKAYLTGGVYRWQFRDCVLLKISLF